MPRDRGPRVLERARGRERFEVGHDGCAAPRELVPGPSGLELVRFVVDAEEVVPERRERPRQRRAARVQHRYVRAVHL